MRLFLFSMPILCGNIFSKSSVSKTLNFHIDKSSQPFVYNYAEHSSCGQETHFFLLLDICILPSFLSFLT